MSRYEISTTLCLGYDNSRSLTKVSMIGIGLMFIRINDQEILIHMSQVI